MSAPPTSITGKPTRRQHAAADREARDHVASSRRRRSGSRCCARRCSTRPTCRRCARAITAPRSCRWRCCARCSGACPTCGFWNFYGQTEIAPLATMLGPEDQLRKAGSAGKPVLNVETRVVDDAMEDVQAGRGRRDRAPLAALHARLFQRSTRRPRRRSRAAGSTRGDLATIDDEGYITVVDRKKDMIKTGGENVASREVEEMIYRTACGVRGGRGRRAGSALGRGGDGDRRAQERPDARRGRGASSIAAARWRLSRCPKRVVFVDSLPKNPSGKLLKRELRQLHQPAA